MIKIRKRYGYLSEYDGSKIIMAILKAMNETENELDKNIAQEIEEEIFDKINESEDILAVEEIQDLIQKKLMTKGKYKTAELYILYRNQRTQERNSQWEMTDLQSDIWHQKYEYENEGFERFLNRVSGGNEKLRKLIRQKKFLFGGRILANRGLHNDGMKVTYSNCYVNPAPSDNLESIFDTAKEMARTYSYGGGMGVSVGKLRPRGALVNNSAKKTTGSCSFMELYSLVTGLIGQNNRRGALMLSMPCNHPDILEFIDIKNDLNKVTNANISIMITDDFMQAVIQDKSYKLSFTVEDTGEKIEKVVKANDIFKKIVVSNWEMAEPGALFWDNISNWHLLSEDDEFEYAGTNPCAV